MSKCVVKEGCGRLCSNEGCGCECECPVIRRGVGCGRVSECPTYGGVWGVGCGCE